MKKCCERDFDGDGNCDRHAGGIKAHERVNAGNIAAEVEKLGPYFKVVPKDPADAESAAVVEKILNDPKVLVGMEGFPFWQEMNASQVDAYIKECAERIDPALVKALGPLQQKCLEGPNPTV